jgi:hypothetical protein
LTQWWEEHVVIITVTMPVPLPQCELPATGVGGAASDHRRIAPRLQRLGRLVSGPTLLRCEFRA